MIYWYITDANHTKYLFLEKPNKTQDSMIKEYIDDAMVGTEEPLTITEFKERTPNDFTNSKEFPGRV